MFVMIWITHLKNIYRSIAADHVDKSASGIEIHIIRITHDRQFGDDLSGIRIENHEPSRQTAADEKSLVRFIQGHGVICKRPGQAPFGAGSPFPGEAETCFAHKLS